MILLWRMLIRMMGKMSGMSDEGFPGTPGSDRNPYMDPRAKFNFLNLWKNQFQDPELVMSEGSIHFPRHDNLE
jgi:hypothetical protein